MPIQAILFDWDLTLVYTLAPDAALQERILHLFAGAGVRCTAAQYEAALAEYAAELQAGRANGSVKPQKKREILQLYRQILNRIGYPDVSRDFIYQIYSAYAELPTFFFADAPPMLDELQAAGYRLGVLSNHSRSARRVIERKASRWIDSSRITISEEEGVHKPTKTVFAGARTRMGAAPEEIVYVGDNLQVDAIGAVQNGGYAAGIWLDRRNRGADTLPDRVRRITTLQQLPAVVADLENPPTP